MADSEPLHIEPEIADYIFQYCTQYRTENESKAFTYYVFTEKSKDSPRMKAFYSSKGLLSPDPEVKALLADGFTAYKHRMIKRIYLEHRQEIAFNRCPKCDRVARTPQARQCRFCGHDWH